MNRGALAFGIVVRELNLPYSVQQHVAGKSIPTNHKREPLCPENIRQASQKQ
jgi:hypothetical protein